MAFLERYLLIKRAEKTGQETICQGIITQHLQMEDQLISFQLARETALHDADRLDLGSFLYSADMESSGSKSVLLFESLREKKVDYVLGNYYLAIESKNGLQPNPADDLHQWI